ncbi:hypothetical protein HMPREF1394_00041 [Helicobacter pylori GAM105Ai]|nr:hypothetical protein HMPREF1394_00041 [Helicobacter pylori GAM105Ai]
MPEQKSIKVKIPNQSLLTHHQNMPYLRKRQIHSKYKETKI